MKEFFAGMVTTLVLEGIAAAAVVVIRITKEVMGE